jgi:hypothetical protein
MIYRRLSHSLLKNRDKVRNWKNKLQDVPCFIIGNAPSLNDCFIHKLDEYFTIGINRAFRRIDPTILLWQDIELYFRERKELFKLKAILYAKDSADPPGMAYHFKLCFGDFRLTDTPAMLHGTGSSGPLAFQLAYVLGCNPIVLVGYDCKYRNGKTDFYGVNKDHKSHTLKSCSRGLKWINDLKLTDRKILSCSASDSFLDSITLEEAIRQCKIDKKNTGREYFKNRLFA